MTHTNALKTARLAAAFSLVAALAACGGGGAPSPAPAPAPAPAPSPAPGDLSTTIQPATYTAGSREALVYQDLNAFRQAGGFGTLAQSTNLDAATKNQSDYAAANYTTTGANGQGVYFEPSTTPGMYFTQTQGVGAFVGATASDRAKAFGYPSGATVAETAALISTYAPAPDFAADASMCVNNTLASPSSREQLLEPRYRDVGIGITTLSQPTSTGTYFMTGCFISVGATPANQATAPADWVGVYPADGSTSTLRFNTDNTNHGFAPSVTVDSNLQLNVTSFTISDPTGAIVATTLNMDAPTEQNWAFATPNAPLAASTTYKVTFVGSAGGNAINKTWSFTTPAQ